MVRRLAEPDLSLAWSGERPEIFEKNIFSHPGSFAGTLSDPLRVTEEQVRETQSGCQTC